MFNLVNWSKNHPVWKYRVLVLTLFIQGGIIGHQFDYIRKIKRLEGPYFNLVFWSLAIGWSAFLATYAFQLHTRYYAEDPGQVDKGYGTLRWSQGFHQFILNFLGGITGWTILYLFVARSNVLNGLDGWEKIILMVVAFIGINGYLPYILLIKGIDLYYN
ncbi:MAG: hypothetical protein HY006_00855 [Candidatus Sungbacteria bacterium]|nr:hypothetical protein [Candidatus Sungbacteria bacterium]